MSSGNPYSSSSYSAARREEEETIREYLRELRGGDDTSDEYDRYNEDGRYDRFENARGSSDEDDNFYDDEDLRLLRENERKEFYDEWVGRQYSPNDPIRRQREEWIGQQRGATEAPIRRQQRIENAKRKINRYLISEVEESKGGSFVKMILRLFDIVVEDIEYFRSPSFLKYFYEDEEEIFLKYVEGIESSLVETFHLAEILDMAFGRNPQIGALSDAVNNFAALFITIETKNENEAKIFTRKIAPFFKHVLPEALEDNGFAVTQIPGADEEFWRYTFIGRILDLMSTEFERRIAELGAPRPNTIYDEERIPSIHSISPQFGSRLTGAMKSYNVSGRNK